MPVGLILESLVAVLLVVTIGYCFILNRRLIALRHGQNEMHAVVLTLNQATEKARVSVEQMRRSSLSIAGDLSEKIKGGRAIADELVMIVESGNSLADRLAGTAASNQLSKHKPDQLEALSRLDGGFRRQIERNGGSLRVSGAVKPDLSVRENSTGNDLRAALRVMR